MASAETATVLRIEKTSIHDGAGLRTVVFLKGCPLACKWCSTPESQRAALEIGLNRHKCNDCGECVSACPEGCFTIDDQGLCRLDPGACSACLACIAACPRDAIRVFGQEMTAQQVIEQISRDEIFYYHSGGGVTISGGECLTQSEFVASVLKECRVRGINTTLETSLHAPWQAIALVLPHLNSLHVDVKHSDTGIHRQLTGVGNERILENLRRVDEHNLPLPVYIRIPLIPGINDSDANLHKTLQLVSALDKVQRIELLAYHRLGTATYAELGRAYGCEQLEPPSADHLRERRDFLLSLNPSVPVTIAG